MSLRPSLQPPDPARALKFALTTRPRGTSLSVDAGRMTVSETRSRTSVGNPNRTERAWGTVIIDREIAGRVLSARTEQNSRVASAVSVGPRRSDHPAGAARGSNGAVSNDSFRSARSDSVVKNAASRPLPLAPRPLRESGPVAPAMKHISDAARTAGRRPNVRPHPTVLSNSNVDQTLTIGATALASEPLQRRSNRETQTLNDEPLVERNLRVAKPPRIRATRRQRRFRFVFSSTFLVLVVLGVFGSAIALHATLAKNQLVLDDVRGQVTEAERSNQRLRVQVAELEAPAHVISVANALGLVASDQVNFVAASVSSASLQTHESTQ